MAQSDQINELAKALADAQPHIKEPLKDKRGNYGPYSSLASLRKAVLPPLNERGISVAQMVGTDEGGDYLETKLLHTSGQWLSSRMSLKLDKPSMQGYGSAITYACRYSLQAISGGGGEEDDDGSIAEHFPSPAVKTEIKSSIFKAECEPMEQGGLPDFKPPSKEIAALPYRIDLGLLKDGKPHWLNGKTLAQAKIEFNKVSQQSRLKDAYDYYKTSKFRTSRILQFMKAYEDFENQDG